MKRSANYSALALIYPHLMRNVRYEKWAQYLNKIIQQYAPAAQSVFELAGGNGSLAEKLSAFYPNYILSDLSFYMLTEGQARIFPSLVCDMRSIPFSERFDVLITAFDSVNYLMKEKDLLRFFMESAHALKDCGILLFDASLESNSYRHANNTPIEYEYQGIIYTQLSEFHALTRTHINSFDIRLPGGETFTEQHRQKIFPLELFFRLLKKAGYSAVYCFDFFTFRAGTPASDRVQFVALKG